MWYFPQRPRLHAGVHNTMASRAGADEAIGERSMNPQVSRVWQRPTLSQLTMSSGAQGGGVTGATEQGHFATAMNYTGGTKAATFNVMIAFFGTQPSPA